MLRLLLLRDALHGGFSTGKSLLALVEGLAVNGFRFLAGWAWLKCGAGIVPWRGFAAGARALVVFVHAISRCFGAVELLFELRGRRGGVKRLCE